MTAAPAKAAALKAISEWGDYRGLHPFSGTDSHHAVDRCASALSGANCILSMLSAACSDSQTLSGKSLNSEFDNRNSEVLAGALDGVSILIDLASFMLDGGENDR